MKQSLTVLFIAVCSIGAATAASVTVNSTRDSFDGATSSISALIASPGPDGVIGLREAITAANNTPGADTINFNIPLSDPGCNPTTHVCTMARTSALPAITDAVTINGYTQPGAHENTNALNAGINAIVLIELSGMAGDLVGGLQINASGTVIRGLNIHGGGDEITVGTSDLGTVASNVTIAGNLIGTNPAGTAAMEHGGSFGIRQNSGNNNIIGGPAAADRNLLSGDPQGGIFISNGDGTQIVGNYIGTDITGTIALNSTGFTEGIGMLSDQTSFFTTNTVISGNLISGNGGGGVDASGGGVIRNNLIGTQRDGISPLGNLNFGGINLRQGNGNPWLVGGTSPGQGNIIAFHTGWGVIVPLTAIRYSILGNSIYSNSQLGISLRGSSSTPLPNDNGDADTFPGNLGQNYPVINSANFSGGSVEITGTLNSSAGTTFRLEFFANQATDSSGFGEGQFFLGSANVTTDGSGNATFDLTFPSPAGLQSVSATATDPNGNTSEFAQSFQTAGSLPPSQLLNISTRGRVLIGDNVMIGGFTIAGTANKTVLVRAIGPSLRNPPFNLTGTLDNPTLSLFNSSQQRIGLNNNWADADNAQSIDPVLRPTDSAESAILVSLPPGAYTAIVSGADGGTGIGLVEVFDLETNVPSRLSNISTRGVVDTGDNVMIGGFIVGPAGGASLNVVVRAIGPSLSLPPFNIANTLQNPTLSLFNDQGIRIQFNDDWQNDQQDEIIATGLQPSNPAESAMVRTLLPGNYTAIVSGVNGTTGVALVEVYALN
jgi:hypothetical protein